MRLESCSTTKIARQLLLLQDNETWWFVLSSFAALQGLVWSLTVQANGFLRCVGVWYFRLWEKVSAAWMIQSHHRARIPSNNNYISKTTEIVLCTKIAIVTGAGHTLIFSYRKPSARLGTDHHFDFCKVQATTTEQRSTNNPFGYKQSLQRLIIKLSSSIE